jgi:hypothetical protein
MFPFFILAYLYGWLTVHPAPAARQPPPQRDDVED